MQVFCLQGLGNSADALLELAQAGLPLRAVLSAYSAAAPAASPSPLVTSEQQLQHSCIMFNLHLVKLHSSLTGHVGSASTVISSSDLENDSIARIHTSATISFCSATATMATPLHRCHQQMSAAVIDTEAAALQRLYTRQMPM